MQTILQSLPPNFWSVDVADVVSLLLTVGLFWVYISMRNIQDEQNDIQRNQNRLMQRQTALMAANHQPRLKIENTEGKDDSLKFLIDNNGEGPADHIHSQCVIYKQNKGDNGPEIRPGFRGAGTVVSSALNPMSRKPTTSIHDDKPPKINKVGESTVEEGEHSVLLEGVVKLKPFSGGSDPYETPFSEVMQRLSREWSDIDYIAFDLFVFFTDVVGEEYGMHVGSYESISLSRDLTFEKSLEQGEKRSRIGDPITEDDAAALIPLNPDEMDFG